MRAAVSSNRIATIINNISMEPCQAIENTHPLDLINLSLRVIKYYNIFNIYNILWFVPQFHIY